MNATTDPAHGNYDLVVIGGGIHGAGIARDAAMRGLRVALFERDDFASGTSSASSKLAHGGLRYLEQMRLGLVREGLHERAVLRRIAPHLVRPLPFLAPVYESSTRGRWWMQGGLTLYDLLAGRSGMGRHRWLDAAAAKRLEPSLCTRGLKGAFRFWDAQMDDARLVIENLVDASRRGALVRNGVAVTGLIVEDRRVVGVHLQERSTGARSIVRAALVVNAAGPWYGEISAAQELAGPLRPRLSRGTHIVVPSLTRGHALLLSAEQDGRVFFVLPFKGRSLVGTTDVDHSGSPDAVEPTEDEIAYLLREVAAQLEGPSPRREDVLFAFAGLRALHAGSAGDPGQVGRDAEINEDAPGLLGVLGGKYTAYRAVSERVVDAALRRLSRRAAPCRTAELPLPGGDVPSMNDYFEVAEDVLAQKYEHLEVGVLRTLLGTYGARHLEILRILDDDPHAGERIEPGLPFIQAEVEFALRHEWARDLEDVLRRRTYRRYLGGLDARALEAWENAFARARRVR